MHAGRIIFSQLLDFLPSHEFHQCVGRYRGNRRLRRFSCLDQFLCMAFAQLTYRESLRDIVTCLGAMKPKLYHAGLRGSVSRSTLADANELRDWRIYADLAAVLIARARKLYAKDSFAVDLDQTVYAFDSTTVDLCLTLFPWAQFRRRKSAVKLHTLIDFRGNIKAFYGTSVNAVKTQVWIAVCVYVLVAIVKKELKIDRSMGEILQILSISLFENTPILQAFSHSSLTMENSTIHNQLSLFDF